MIGLLHELLPLTNKIGIEAEIEYIRLVQPGVSAAYLHIIDVSKYQPKKVPSLNWCECIALKRLEESWKDDLLICPECGLFLKNPTDFISSSLDFDLYFACFYFSIEKRDTFWSIAKKGFPIN